MASLQDIEIQSFQGLRGRVSQSYTEANVKSGVQYEFDLQGVDIPAGASLDVVVVTGSQPVAIKGFAAQFDEVGFTRTTYENPSYTGGVPAPYYNKNYMNPVAGEVVILANVTVTDTGTQVSATRRYLGSEAQGNRVISTQATPAFGLETILAPNTPYLIRTVNIATVSQNIISYATWYEGGLDLPRPQNDN